MSTLLHATSRYFNATSRYFTLLHATSRYFNATSMLLHATSIKKKHQKRKNLIINWTAAVVCCCSLQLIITAAASARCRNLQLSVAVDCCCRLQLDATTCHSCLQLSTAAARSWLRHGGNNISLDGHCNRKINLAKN